MPLYRFTKVFHIELPNDELAQRVSNDVFSEGVLSLRVVTADDIRVQRSTVVDVADGRIVQDIDFSVFNNIESEG